MSSELSSFSSSTSIIPTLSSDVICISDLPTIRNQLDSSANIPPKITEIVTNYLFHNNNPVVFDRDIPTIRQELFANTTMEPDVIPTVLQYLKSNDNPFGRAEWIEQGYDPGPVPEWSKELSDFWYGPDPIDPTKQVSETHIPPVFQPEFLTDLQTSKVMPVSLKTCRQIGLPFHYAEAAFQQNQNQKAGPACFLVMRKGVVEETRNKTTLEQVEIMKTLNAKTGAGYEELPSIINLACIVFARYVFKGERNLGDDTGAKTRWTYSRCAETYKFGKCEYHLEFRGFAPGGSNVSIDSDNYDDNLGVVALRKFSS
jgi:hypothetical protein